MGRQGFEENDTICRSGGVLVGVLGDRIVACDVVGHEAHVLGGLLAWLVLLDETTRLADLVADVVASTGSTEQVAREEVTGALHLGRSLHLLGRESRSPAPARRERTVLLRAGAVRTPSGDIWLLPGGDDRGVATLIGELVQAGCDDLGREVVCVHGDSIVAESPASLQGEHGPIAGILVCEHLPDNEASAVPLDPYDTAEELTSSALNLSRTGDPGLQMLCDLAATAPGLRIRHHDPVALARVLVATEEWDSLGDLDWQLRRHHRENHGLAQPVTSYLDDLGVCNAGDVTFHDATIEGEDVMFVIDRSGYRAWALTGLRRRIWLAVSGDNLPNLSELLRNEADNRGGSDERSALVVARALTSLMEQGVIDQVAGEVGPGAADLAGGGHQSEHAQEMWRCGPSGPRVSPVSVAEPWPSLTSGGDSIDWLGHRLVTDIDSIRRVLIGIRGASVGVGPARLTQDAALVEIRSIPDRVDEMLIRLNGTRLWYVSKDDRLPVLGMILADLAADHVRFAQPLGEISIATWHDRCVVKVGAASAKKPSRGDEGGVRHRPALFGARVDNGKVLVPEPTRAEQWLTDGASIDEVADLWTPYLLAGVVALGARDVLGGWLRTLTALSPDEGASERYLSETVAHGDVPLLVVNDEETLSGAAERVLAGTGDPAEIWDAEPAIPIGRIAAEPSASETDLSSAAWRWASRLGEASWVEESAKITTGRLSIGRGLLKIRLPKSAGASLDGSASLASDLVRDAIAELGVNLVTCEEVARASLAAGNLYLGVEPAGSHIRRKLYVRGLPTPAWRQIASRWPHGLKPGNDTPYWLAWKWTEDGSGGVERAVYLANLGGAETIGKRVDPLMEVMEPEWVDVVGHLLGLLGIGRQQFADDGDLLTLDEAGRRSVDISRRSPVRGSHGFEAESRWLAHAAALSDADSRDLVVWSQGRHVSRLIFGIDGRGEPFVNLYGSQFTDR